MPTTLPVRYPVFLQCVLLQGGWLRLGAIRLHSWRRALTLCWGNPYIGIRAPHPVRCAVHTQCVPYREGCLHTHTPPCKRCRIHPVRILQGGVPAAVGGLEGNLARVVCEDTDGVAVHGR